MAYATPAARLPASAVCHALLLFETPVKYPFTNPKPASVPLPRIKLTLLLPLVSFGPR